MCVVDTEADPDMNARMRDLLKVLHSAIATLMLWCETKQKQEKQSRPHTRRYVFLSCVVFSHRLLPLPSCRETYHKKGTLLDTPIMIHQRNYNNVCIPGVFVESRYEP